MVDAAKEPLTADWFALVTVLEAIATVWVDAAPPATEILPE
jgi:hypothetical protein